MDFIAVVVVMLRGQIKFELNILLIPTLNSNFDGCNKDSVGVLIPQPIS